MAVTCPQVHESSQRPSACCRLERASQDAGIAHPRVDAAQIAARANGAGIVSWERIQPLGFDLALHTVNSTDFQNSAMATEASPKRRHPPQPVGHAV